eukprot:s2926_g2.t1
MREANWTPDAISYNASISASEKGGQWQQACALLEAMREANVDPNIISYNASISACGNGGQWQQACALLEAMREANLTPDAISYSAAISACGKGGQWQQAFALLEAMCEAKVYPNIISYSASISACGKCGQWQQALILFDAMPRAKVVPDRGTLNALLDCQEIQGRRSLGGHIFKHALLPSLEKSSVFQGLKVDLHEHSEGAARLTLQWWLSKRVAKKLKHGLLCIVVTGYGKSRPAWSTSDVRAAAFDLLTKKLKLDARILKNLAYSSKFMLGCPGAGDIAEILDTIDTRTPVAEREEWILQHLKMTGRSTFDRITVRQYEGESTNKWDMTKLPLESAHCALILAERLRDDESTLAVDSRNLTSAIFLKQKLDELMASASGGAIPRSISTATNMTVMTTLTDASGPSSSETRRKPGFEGTETVLDGNAGVRKQGSFMYTNARETAIYALAVEHREVYELFIQLADPYCGIGFVTVAPINQYITGIEDLSYHQLQQRVWNSCKGVLLGWRDFSKYHPELNPDQKDQVIEWDDMSNFEQNIRCSLATAVFHDETPRNLIQFGTAEGIATTGHKGVCPKIFQAFPMKTSVLARYTACYAQMIPSPSVPCVVTGCKPRKFRHLRGREFRNFSMAASDAGEGEIMAAGWRCESPMRLDSQMVAR